MGQVRGSRYPADVDCGYGFRGHFIILGAGSAGCVLANRLSESGEHSVLIVEAGPMDKKLMIHIPAGVHSVYKDPSINWNYKTEPEANLQQRHIELPRGKD